MNTPKFLIVHHEASPFALRDNVKRFDAVDDYHTSKGWGGIGYHYFIERDGEVKQGRQDNAEGAHTIGKNTESLGICMAGNMDLQMPSSAQVKSLKTLVQQKMKEYLIFPSNVVGHRKYANKSCPGKLLSDQWIADLIEAVAVSVEKPVESCATEKKTIKSLIDYIAKWILGRK